MRRINVVGVSGSGQIDFRTSAGKTVDDTGN